MQLQNDIAKQSLNKLDAQLSIIKDEQSRMQSRMDLLTSVYDDGSIADRAEAYKQAVEDCNGKVQYDNLFDRKFFPSGMWGIMADSMSMMLSNPDDVTEAVEYLRDNYLELYAEQNG